MQKRIFGLENEYSAFLGRDGEYFLDCPADYLGLNLQNPESDLAKKFLVLEYRSVGIYSGFFWLGSNGAKFYFDNPDKIPEYATPECDSVLDAVLHDKAGEIFLEAVRADSVGKRVLAAGDSGVEDEVLVRNIILSKNTAVFTNRTSVANKRDLCVGCHENYYTYFSFDPQWLEKNRFSKFLLPFLASRVVISGAGGIRPMGRGKKYVVSQRAFSIATECGSLVTEQRPFITFKPVASEEFIRLQVNCSDPNMSPFAAFLKIGTAHLVLRVFEEKKNISPPVCFLDNVRAMQQFALDTRAGIRVRDTAGKRYLTAVQAQKEYLELVLKYLRDLNEEERKIIQLWQWTLEKLEENPEELHRHLDWVTRLYWLRKLGYDFNDPKAVLFDFSYSDISEKGVYNKLRKTGKVEEFVTDEQILHALYNPPPTRAALRARYIRHFLSRNTLRPCIIDWDYVGSPFIRFPDPFSNQNEELDKFISRTSAK